MNADGNVLQDMGVGSLCHVMSPSQSLRAHGADPATAVHPAGTELEQVVLGDDS